MATSIFPHTFRLHWLISYLMVSVRTQLMLMAIFGAVALSYFIQNGNVVLEGFQIAGSACFIIGVIMLPVAMRLNHLGRVRIGPFGIEATDDRGTRRVIDWNKMESVAIVRNWGWRSIRVRTSDGRTLWLPLYVSRPEEYGEVVEQYAGADHPLSRALSFARPES